MKRRILVVLALVLGASSATAPALAAPRTANNGCVVVLDLAICIPRL